VFAILGADRLGIPIGRVLTDLGDSASPVSANAGGSSSTASNGSAVQLAADGAITALIQLAVQNPASPFAGKDPATVTYANGSLRSDGVSVTFGGLLTSLDVAGVEATVKSPKNSTQGYGFFSFGAHFCEVRVNRWTGEPRVSRLLSTIDAGTIVNTKASRSQVMGGVIMGLGQALLEETRVEATGRFANADLAGYLLPVHADVPHIDVEFVGAPDPVISPLGARGIGELGIVGVAGAIASAVHNATGKRVRELPITLEKLLT
jgi:xanthine dehydrogenase YagR molybdenum-binding subunit